MLFRSDSLPIRLLARLLARGGSEVRARQQLRELSGVLQINALLAATVLLPAALMAWFALTTIQSEVALVDADLKQRADAVITHTSETMESMLGTFEDRALERLAVGQATDTNLAQLSPYLLGSFRYDSTGQLASPFELPVSEPPVEATPAFRSAWKRAVQLDRSEEYSDAAWAFRIAGEVAQSPSLIAEATLGRARSQFRMGDPDAATRTLAEVSATASGLRDRTGYRISDLIDLQRADLARLESQGAESTAYVDLVNDLLAARWVIGRPNEASVARRALTRVEQVADSDWVGRQRTRLNERTRQLYWAEILIQELELFRGTARRADNEEFRYVLGNETGALWATIDRGDNRYAFAFDLPEIIMELSGEVANVTALDPDINASLVLPGELRPNNAIDGRSLAPRMPQVSVVITPSDPELVTTRKRKRRQSRLLILFAAVCTSLLGLTVSIRLVRTVTASARMKTDFAANVSHELRSPITQIRLKAEALQLDLLVGPEKDRAYEVIVRESERLSRLVDNVLDFAAIEAGAKSYTFRVEDIGDILAKSVRSESQQLEAAGLDIELDIASNLPMVRVDRDAIGQVVTNLLSNAAKYGAAGGWVGITARRTPKAVQFIVADKGMGISPEDLDQLFVHFFRSEDADVRKQKGTGIGLSIVRYIVEAHGGEIRADSTRGIGTRFIVTLPLTAALSGV